MKKFLLFIVAFVAITFVGCSKGDDNSDKSDTSNEYNIEIYAKGGTVSDKPKEYNTGLNEIGTSDNIFVATVDNGVITAQHVGFAKVIIGDNTYNTTVKSTLNTFIPPVTEFYKSQDYIASKETRERSKGSHLGLIYDGENDLVHNVAYLFGNNDSLYEIRIKLKKGDKSTFAVCATYLGHLYKQIEAEIIDGVYNLVYIDNYKIEDAIFKVYLPQTYSIGEVITIKFIPLK
ncbi:hypothetical protein [Alistipes finegoldii]|jgi:hypothetical protein|uniref:hypothetical protein n=1 Tax=Alistipes finegoldii TaxID=214856 RepID=UPI00242B8B75|nr:hypothetical protein [Alistipes finegoldii]